MKVRQARKIVSQSAQGRGDFYSFDQITTAMATCLRMQRARIGERSFLACCRVIHHPAQPAKPKLRRRGMYHVYQHQLIDGKHETVHIGERATADEAVNLCNEAEEAWTEDLYGGCFISQDGIVVGDREGVTGGNHEPSEILGYSHACGYHD